MYRPGVELAISRSQVRRPNHYTTEPPNRDALHNITLYKILTLHYSILFYCLLPSWRFMMLGNSQILIRDSERSAVFSRQLIGTKMSAVVYSIMREPSLALLLT